MGVRLAIFVAWVDLWLAFVQLTDVRTAWSGACTTISVGAWVAAGHSLELCPGHWAQRRLLFVLSGFGLGTVLICVQVIGLGFLQLVLSDIVGVVGACRTFRARRGGVQGLFTNLEDRVERRSLESLSAFPGIASCSCGIPRWCNTPRCTASGASVFAEALCLAGGFFSSAGPCSVVVWVAVAECTCTRCTAALVSCNRISGGRQYSLQQCW